MAISRGEYKKKYGNTNDVNNVKMPTKSDLRLIKKADVQSITETPSLNTLKEKKEVSKQKFDTSKKELNTFLKKSGVVTDDRNSISKPTPFTVMNQSVSKSTPFKDRPTLETGMQNIKKYDATMSSNEGKELTSKVFKNKNDYAKAYSDYEYNRGLLDYEKVGPAATAIFSGLNSAKSMLGFRDNPSYKDPKTGTTYELPTYDDGLRAGLHNSNHNVWKAVDAVSDQVGRNLASAGLNAIIPYSGTTLYHLDSFKRTYNSAIQEGHSKSQSANYAGVNTLVELLTTKLLGASVGKLMKTGNFEKGISNTLRKFISSEKTNKILASALSEGTEEFIQEYADNIQRNLILGEKNDLLSSEIFQDALYSGLIGALSSGLSESAKQALKGSVNSQIDQIIYDIEKSNNKTLSDFNKKQISNNVKEQYLANDGVVNPNQVVENFNAEIKARTDSLMESATREGLDVTSEKGRSLLNTLNKLIQDRGYEITFDSSIGENKNGVNLDGNTIKINPNSPRALEFVAMHEVTHSISTNKMRNLVLDFAEKNSKLKEQLNSLKELYKTNEISDEVLADISGQLFGNQEFINMLKNDEPGTFKKLYNGIVSIANKITGNSNETLFVKNLQNMWENAYRSSDSNGFNNYKASIEQDKIGNKYVKADRQVITGNNPLLWEKQVENYINNQIRNGKDINVLTETGDILTITKDTAGKAKFRNYSLDKNGNKHYMTNEEFQTKLTAETHIDELAQISKQKNKSIVPDYKNHEFAKDGFNYRTAFFEDYDGNYYKITMSIGKNGDINTIYNVGKLEQRKRPVINGSSVKNGADGSLTTSNISQSNQEVKSSIFPSKYSMQKDSNNTWQKALENTFPSQGTQTYAKDIKMPIKGDLDSKTATNKTVMPIGKDTPKSLDPIRISNLTLEDSNTTPKLPNVERTSKYDGKSSFFDNIRDKTNMLNEKQKETILSEDEVKYYDKVTNKESLEKAFKRLENGKYATEEWFIKASEEATDVDVAQGWILMKQYADAGDADGMVAVSKKMRDMGTKAGQTVQAFNIMERMTPEGMVKYAQSELLEAYDKMVKNKSKEWIDKYRKDFDLKPDEVQFIMDTMKEISTMDDGYDKRVKLAEIQKLMTDKLPPQKGSAIKSWMRISMLFNPKTQVRNVAGNAIIMPVNYFGDMFSSYADKLISKKTGVRTTGNINVKAVLKGFKEGAYQATNDYRKGINTKDMEGNRFEIGEGKSFNDKTAIGKSLNRVEGLLNYIMDAGDRMFSQSSFENSIQNQLVLNNTSEITQDMIDIARTESLQRTWNDNNNYTKFVLDVRRMLNKIGTDKYGLGDILIPFAKTPANLTKAIVDYSPVGLVNTLIKGNNLKKSLSNGQYTVKMQHEFVQTLGKATAGTLLYVAGIALAKAGITSGKSDDDKDTANFLKNTLGVSSYSINIGGKSYTYDWAQPLAAPFSITANIVNSKNKETALLESVVGSLDTAGSILLEQSFLSSLNDVLSDNDGVVSGLLTEILELPARAVPTFSKQIVDLTDSTQRTSYEYGKPLQSAVNSIKAKIPLLSTTLAPSVDTMGREIQRYGGKNNIFNVFLNPANVNTENISESAEEIYRVYKQTGDKSIMPRVAPYYINSNGDKIILSSKQKSDFQKEAGSIIEDSIDELLKKTTYKNLGENEKSSIIKKIIDYSYNNAREKVVGLPMGQTYNKISEYVSKGGKVSDYYLNKDEINYALQNEEKYTTITQITSYDKYVTYKKELEEIQKNSNNRKNDTIDYINSLNLSIPQKAMFIKLYYPAFRNYDANIVQYLNDKELSYEEKKNILEELKIK